MNQLASWMFAALVPCAIQLNSGSSWLAILIVSLTSVILLWARCKWGEIPRGKTYAAAMWLYVVLIIGVLSRKSIDCWPEGGHLAVPLILLALALWSSLKGPKAAAGIGAVLFWLFLLLYVVLFAAGIKQVKGQWLLPTRSDADPLGCILLLTPLAVCNLGKGNCVNKRTLLLYIIVIAASVITLGVLSPAVAYAKEYPFYEMTRSLTILGRARRFEAVLSATTTIGWYVLLTIYISIGADMAEQISADWRQKGAIAAAIVSAVLIIGKWSLPAIALLVTGVVLWLVMPLINGILTQIKKS